MRVDVTLSDGGFDYTLTLDADDRLKGRSLFCRPAAEQAIQLVGRSYRVELGPLFHEIHPDLHASAIWRVVHPFLGHRLTLSFGVSAAFAETMEVLFGVAIGPVDGTCAPRPTPATPAPALLFSGGADSTGASLVMPSETHLLFLDRIIPAALDLSQDELIDCVQQRRLGAALAARGRSVVFFCNSHETLYAPYPYSHSEMAVLPGLYLADSLGLGPLDTGSVFNNLYDGGYYWDGRHRWRYRPSPDTGRPPDAFLAHPLLGYTAPPEGEAGDRLDRNLAQNGLFMGGCVTSLSEVGTSLLVHRSDLRGKTYSCFQRSSHNYCLSCDKCLRKLLLVHVFSDKEVPPPLIDHFLAQPRLAQLLERPYFDFHDVWVYLLQRVRCRHPRIMALQQVAQTMPDLGFMERAYPAALFRTPPSYRAVVTRNLSEKVGFMTPAEVATLESLDLPPLNRLVWAE